MTNPKNYSMFDTTQLDYNVENGKWRTQPRRRLRDEAQAMVDEVPSLALRRVRGGRVLTSPYGRSIKSRLLHRLHS